MAWEDLTVMAFSCLPFLVLAERSTLVVGVGEGEEEEEEEEVSGGEEENEGDDEEVGLGGELKVTLLLGGQWGDWSEPAARCLIFGLLCSSGGAGSGGLCPCGGASGLAGPAVARCR